MKWHAYGIAVQWILLLLLLAGLARCKLSLAEAHSSATTSTSTLMSSKTTSGSPDPPASVQVRCYNTNRQAEIWWQPGKENYAPILNFIIQYNTSFAPDTWYDIATNVSQTERRMVVSMSPWGNYTFRVIARNKIGLSLPSMQTFNICSTQPDVPDKNPENVIGEGDEPNNLIIFWTPMPPIEQNGPDFKYILTWRQMNDTNNPQGGPLNMVTIRRADAIYFVPPDVMPTYKAYYITVKASNAMGDSSADLKPVIGYSGEAAPNVYPTDVTYVEETLKATTVNLTWTPIDTSPELVRGFFRGYRVEFAVDNSDWAHNLSHEDFIINETPQYPRRGIRKRSATSTTPKYTMITLTGLPSNSSIRAQVRVLNKRYAGPQSNPVTFTTPEQDDWNDATTGPGTTDPKIYSSLSTSVINDSDTTDPKIKDSASVVILGGDAKILVILFVMFRIYETMAIMDTFNYCSY